MDELLSAVVAFGVAFVTAFVSIQLQKERLRTEMRTQFMAEEAIRQLLLQPKWKLRSFDVIKRRLGGFDDDVLRQLLVRAGALRFEGPNGQELWGLREKNADALT